MIWVTRKSCLKIKKLEEVSKASQAKTENLLNEVNDMSWDSESLLITFKMEIDKEQMHQRYLLEAKQQTISFEFEMK